MRATPDLPAFGSAGASPSPGLKLLLLAGLAIGGFAETGAATDTGPIATHCEARSCCNCRDDYCPKPLPCVPCAPLGKCDCYCPKPLPCLPCDLHYCAPDDYCPKPCCLYLPPCWPAWYTCGAPNCAPAAK